VVSVRTPVHRRRRRRAGARSSGEPRDVTTSTGAVAHSASDSAVQLKNLRVTYAAPDGSELEVVHGVTLDVAPGEVLGIVGESGSGKSQTVFSMLDLLPAGGACTADAIWIGGRDVTRLGHKDRQRLLGHEVGYIPQEPMSNLDPSFTIGHQLMEPLRAVHKLGRAAARERALEMLAKVGIPDPARVMKSYPHQLSGGMAQRAALARALVNEPRLLLLDEPLGKLDALTRLAMQAEILRLWQEKRFTALLVTHDVEEALVLAERVIVLSDRPAAIRAALPVAVPYPRHRDDPEIVRLRREILGILGQPA
jgi:ABC-type glutathione transport system ATPase component